MSTLPRLLTGSIDRIRRETLSQTAWTTLSWNWYSSGLNKRSVSCLRKYAPNAAEFFIGLIQIADASSVS